MRKPFALLAAALLLALLVAAIFAGPASATELYQIPLWRHVPVSPTMDVVLQQLTISDTTWGGSYAPDLSAVLFAGLSFEYENHGAAPEHGHLHVQFMDDKGQVYDSSDQSFYTVPPNGTLSNRFIEINFPKDRKIVQLNVILGFETVTVPINYPGASTPTPSPAPGSSPTTGPSGGLCAGALLLPLVLVGTAWIGRRLAGQ